MMVVAFSILIDCSITILSFQLQSILEKTNSLPTLWKLSDNQSLGGKQKFGAPSKASYSEKCYIQSFFFFFFLKLAGSNPNSSSLFLYNFYGLLSTNSYYKVLSVFLILYNISLSLSYIQYFVPLTSTRYITSHLVTTICLLFINFVYSSFMSLGKERRNCFCMQVSTTPLPYVILLCSFYFSFLLLLFSC